MLESVAIGVQIPKSYLMNFFSLIELINSGFLADFNVTSLNRKGV